MMTDDKALQEIKEELKEIRKDVNRLLNYEQFKKDSKVNFVNGIRVAILLLPIVMGAIGWMGYEAGLYKPIPHQQVKK